MPSFETPADIFTCLSVFDSPKGSSDTFKTYENIMLLLTELEVYTRNYYMTNSYKPGLKKFDWFKAGL